MAEKRRDKKGRILKTGESQRPNLTYQYRYKDIHGKTIYTYAPTLEKLREKESMIQRDLSDGISYAAGEVTVLELAQRYLAQKQNVRYNTKNCHNFVLNLICKEDFGSRKIRTVKPSDARLWFIKLHNDGYSYSTLTSIRGVLRPAFEMAVEDDIVRRNPFSFKVVDVVPNDTVKRDALTAEEQAQFLEFIMADKCRKRYYDEIVILLGTGLRVSELYGLTKADIDFQRQRIRVERQLLRTGHCEYYVEKPKTSSGERYIPMDKAVIQAFQNVIRNRKSPKMEVMVGGYSGFLFLDKDGKPKVAGHLEHAMKRMVDKYNATHDIPIRVTPHVLRHTFSTNMAQKGMLLKELQYILGHADAGTTTNVYLHSNYDVAEKAFFQVVGQN